MTKPTFSLNFDLLGALDVLTYLGRTLADIWHSLGSSLPILTVLYIYIVLYRSILFKPSSTALQVGPSDVRDLHGLRVDLVRSFVLCKAQSNGETM